MSSRGREYLHRRSKVGVKYVYNDKFECSDKENAPEAGNRSKTIQRGRALSTRDLNCMDSIMPVLPSTSAGQFSLKNGDKAEQPAFCSRSFVQAAKREISSKAYRRVENAAKKLCVRNILKASNAPFEVQTSALDHLQQAPDRIQPASGRDQRTTNPVIPRAIMGSNSRSQSLEGETLGIVNLDTSENPISSSVSYAEPYLEDIVCYLVLKETEQDTSIVDEAIFYYYFLDYFMPMLHKCKDRFETGIGEAITAIKIYEQVYDYFDEIGGKLASAAILWIANKICTIFDKQIKLQGIVDLWLLSDFEKKQLLFCERNILNLMDFNLFVHDPMALAAYYVLHMGLSQAQQIWNCTSYVLECVIKTKYILQAPTSKLTAAAVLNSLCYLRIAYKWADLSQCHGYYSEETLLPICKMLKKTFSLAHHDLEIKYSTDEYGSIYNVLVRNLED